MRTNIIVVEQFYSDPDAVRAYALRQRYYFPYQPAEAVEAGRLRPSWMSTWFRPPDDCPFKSSSELIRLLEHITGDRIDLEHWRGTFPLLPDGRAAPNCANVERSCLWNCCFHFKPEGEQPLGEGVHNHVTDAWNSVGPNGWAGLIYLAPQAPLSGGLKLWRNRNPERNFDWMTPRPNWEQIDDLGNLYNRLILCRGNLPHSGAAGWGTRLHEGRLYQTFFFKVKQWTSQPAITLSLG